MKKLTGIFLIAIMLVPFTGTYLWFQYQKKLIRKEVKEKIINSIDRQALVILKFTKAEITKKLKWEHSKEFEYKDQMYDIVETKTEGDTITYWCWPDHKETKLNKKLKILITKALGNNQQNKENQKRCQNFYKSLYHPGLSDFDGMFLLPRDNKIQIYFSSVLSNIYLSPPVPPPEIS